jgi:hypothetical protein
MDRLQNDNDEIKDDEPHYEPGDRDAEVDWRPEHFRETAQMLVRALRLQPTIARVEFGPYATAIECPYCTQGVKLAEERTQYERAAYRQTPYDECEHFDGIDKDGNAVFLR